MKIFYVYIVECKDKSFYIGVTSNLEKRIEQHNAGIDQTAYTYIRRPVVLKWFEQFSDPSAAFKVEKQLKGWSRRKKIALIQENWDNLIEYSRNYNEYGSFENLE